MAKMTLMTPIILTGIFSLFSAINSEASSTYFVDTSEGNDNTSCLNAQNEQTPKNSIGAAVSCLSAGDVIEIKPGTYVESLDNIIPSGTSWDNATTLRAQQEGSVIIRPNSGGKWNDVIAIIGKKYIILDGLIIDGTNVSQNGLRLSGSSRYIRIQNGEFRNSLHWNGIFVQDDTTIFNEFINLKIYGNGEENTNQHHGIYIRGDDNIIDNCEIYNNTGYGVHIYGKSQEPARNIVKNSRIYNNGERGLILGSGTDNVAYNNLIYGNEKSGIQIGYGATNSKAINNTIIQNGIYGIEIISSATNTTIMNNILTNNSFGPWTNSGSQSSFTTNLESGNTNFVDETANDFRIQEGSDAIDAGTSTNEVTDDFFGTQRPQGTTHDVGAHEWLLVSSTTPPRTSNWFGFSVNRQGTYLGNCPRGN